MVVWLDCSGRLEQALLVLPVSISVLVYCFADRGTSDYDWVTGILYVNMFYCPSSCIEDRLYDSNGKKQGLCKHGDTLLRVGDSSLFVLTKCSTFLSQLNNIHAAAC